MFTSSRNDINDVFNNPPRITDGQHCSFAEKLILKKNIFNHAKYTSTLVFMQGFKQIYRLALLKGLFKIQIHLLYFHIGICDFPHFKGHF